MAKSSTLEAPVVAPVTKSPVLAVGFGRGFGGKSTLLSEIAWRAQNQGRSVIVADFDARSKTLADLFPDAMVPPTEELPDVKAAFSKLLNRMTKEKTSAVVDFGGGDRFMLEYGRDLMLVEFCARRGIEPVAIYVLGPEVEDLRHCFPFTRPATSGRNGRSWCSTRASSARARPSSVHSSRRRSTQVFRRCWPAARSRC